MITIFFFFFQLINVVQFFETQSHYTYLFIGALKTELYIIKTMYLTNHNMISIELYFFRLVISIRLYKVQYIKPYKHN